MSRELSSVLVVAAPKVFRADIETEGATTFLVTFRDGERVGDNIGECFCVIEAGSVATEDGNKTW